MEPPLQRRGRRGRGRGGARGEEQNAVTAQLFEFERKRNAKLGKSILVDDSRKKFLRSTTPLSRVEVSPPLLPCHRRRWHHRTVSSFSFLLTLVWRCLSSSDHRYCCCGQKNFAVKNPRGNSPGESEGKTNVASHHSLLEKISIKY